jgi:hypothetical protein
MIRAARQPVILACALTLALDWTMVGDRGSAAALATTVETTERALTGDTSIGGLLRFTTDYIQRAPFQSARWIVDVSGDGTSSSGDQPDRFRDRAVAKGIVINGLAVLNEFPTLEQYYADHVIGGPEAFVVAARDYGHLARAMRIKAAAGDQRRAAGLSWTGRQRRVVISQRS